MSCVHIEVLDGSTAIGFGLSGCDMSDWVDGAVIVDQSTQPRVFISTADNLVSEKPAAGNLVCRFPGIIDNDKRPTSPGHRATDSRADADAAPGGIEVGGHASRFADAGVGEYRAVPVGLHDRLAVPQMMRCRLSAKTNKRSKSNTCPLCRH